MKPKPTTLALLIVTACTTSACVSNRPMIEREPVPVRVDTQIRKHPGELAASIAQRQIGIRYRYGGATPASGFDCSGLVHYSFSQAGLVVPRTSRDQFRAAHKISLSQAEPGDVVFFQDQEKLSHVGIYLGNGRFVHAPSSGKSVSVGRIDAPYYQEHLVAVGRLGGS